MQIDFISDTVCPWCFIGKRRLTRAMAMRPDIPFTVRYRPYRLDPTVPREGVDRAAYMAARFGADAKLLDAYKAIAAEGAKEDISFDWQAILKRPNTIDSHRLIRWAEAQGVQDEVVERLFIAYFENGEDIGDIRVLADIADLCGMDGGEVAAQIKADPALKHIPVVFLTALVSEHEALAGSVTRTGHRFVGKLVSSANLIAFIEQTLAQS